MASARRMNELTIFVDLFRWLKGSELKEVEEEKQKSGRRRRKMSRNTHPV
jgi:hypothetical protein